MVAFPNQQAFTQPWPRKRTQQGGNGRAIRGAAGLPNVRAMGLNNLVAEGQHQIPGGSPGPTYAPPLPGQNNGGNQHGIPGGSPGPVFGGGGGGGGAGPGGGDAAQYWGANPNRLMSMLNNFGDGSMGGPRPYPMTGPGMLRNPLDHLRWWESMGWKYNENSGRFHRVPGAPVGGGGFGGPDDGRPNPMGGGGVHPNPQGGPNQGGPNGGGGGGNGQGNGNGNGQGGPPPDDGWSDIPGLPAGYKPTMPLDAEFTAQVKLLNDALSAARSNAQIGYDTGNAALNYQSDQQNRALDSSMASRGLFGSGIERRGERLIGNDIGLARSGLLQQLTGAQGGAQSDYSRGLMEALLALAQRSAADQNMALPGF